MTQQANFPPGIELPGRVWSRAEPAWVPDVARDPDFTRAPYAAKVGLHGAIGFPIRLGREVLAVMEFFSNEIQEPDKSLLEMLAMVGSQVGQFLQRRRAAVALRDSEALYRSLVDTLPVHILRKDLQGRITFANRFYCDNMGRTLPELLGKTDFDLFPSELAEKYVRDDRQVIATGRVFEDVERHQTPAGKRVYVQVLKGPVLDASGVVVGTQVIFWDVTARKEAEEALARTAADLARSNCELEQFAYVASHDLQEPLRMIASYTQLLERRYGEKLDQDAREFIGYAVDGALRMQRLIQELLTYSRVDTRGKQFESVNGETVLAAALENLKFAIEESGATITHDALPTLLGDPVQIIQLLQNLLSNAIKFRGQEPPRIHISVSNRKHTPDGAQPADAASGPAPDEEWVITVRDNGIGIDPQYFDRIFAIFTRLHTREEYPGTGLGLALCKKIVERHGGRMWVESQPGKGASFCFTVPMVPAKAHRNAA